MPTRREFAEDPGAVRHPRLGHRLPHGELGDPPGGWPEPFRTKALDGPHAGSAPAGELTDEHRAASPASRPRAATLNRAAVPRPDQGVPPSPARRYGDVSVLPTVDYLYGLRQGDEHEVELEEGVRCSSGLEAIGEPDERGLRTVMATLNGQLRPISVRDRSVAADVAAAEKADPAKPGQVAAPFPGVVTLVVEEGDEVEAGDTVATIEAMKMEAAITAPVGGHRRAPRPRPAPSRSRAATWCWCSADGSPGFPGPSARADAEGDPVRPQAEDRPEGVAADGRPAGGADQAQARRRGHPSRRCRRGRAPRSGSGCRSRASAPRAGCR